VVVDTVKQGDHRVVCEGTLNLIGVPLVEAKLAISVSVVRVVAATLILLILHEVEIPVEAVEGIPEEQGHKAVCPGVCSKHVENAQFWTTEPDSSQELKLEVGLAVELALYVVFQD